MEPLKCSNPECQKEAPERLGSEPLLSEALDNEGKISWMCPHCGKENQVPMIPRGLEKGW